MKKKTLLSFTLAIMATMWTTSMQAQEYYDLTIALVQVTSRNCNDLSFITGVSGTVKVRQCYEDAHAEECIYQGR